MNLDKLAERIRAEFDEMPELVLTLAQASKFFGIDLDVMRRVTEQLVESAYLRRTPNGALARMAG
jgi:hypothetical protein